MPTMKVPPSQSARNRQAGETRVADAAAEESLSGHMASDATIKIATWFGEHEDGEFLRLPTTHPYAGTIPSPDARCILYTTKPPCVLHALEQCADVASIQVVGRPGLPNEDDARWLQALAGDREILFLGDCDPADLLVFAWLRSQIPLTHVGVSDSLVRSLSVHVEDNMTIPLADSEREAAFLLTDVWPDYRQVVGSQCAGLLERGRKLEVEAVISWARGRTSLRDVFAY